MPRRKHWRKSDSKRRERSRTDESETAVRSVGSPSNGDGLPATTLYGLPAVGNPFIMVVGSPSNVVAAGSPSNVVATGSPSNVGGTCKSIQRGGSWKSIQRGGNLKSIQCGCIMSIQRGGRQSLQGWGKSYDKSQFKSQYQPRNSKKFPNKYQSVQTSDYLF